MPGLLCCFGYRNCQQHIATSAACFLVASGMLSWLQPALVCSHHVLSTARPAVVESLQPLAIWHNLQLPLCMSWSGCS